MRTVLFGTNEYYHIYNRGVDKRIIYEDDNDRKRFVDLLYLSNSDISINYREIKRQHQSVFEFETDDNIVSIGAYCLMPNHFHLLVKAKDDQGVAKFVNKLCTGYSMYFNKKHERSGALFQGRFKAKHVDSDEYLKYLFSYIHLNPLRLGDTKDRPLQNIKLEHDKESLLQLKGYRWSSLIDYLNSKREEARILDKDEFPKYFQNTEELESELFDWIGYESITKLPQD